jgi:hypothetical protein
MPNCLGTRPQKNPAVKIARSAIHAEKLVYVARANKKLNYKLQKSAIAYIGTDRVHFSGPLGVLVRELV